MMTDSTEIVGLNDATVVDVMASAMIDRFGRDAVSVATNQLAVAHAAGDAIADHWLSVVLSIDERLGLGRRTGQAPSHGQAPRG